MMSNLHLLLMFTPLLISCINNTNATSQESTVNYTVIASGSNNISGISENKKIEVFSSQTSFNSSFANYVQFITEHTIDFTSKRAVLLSMGVHNTGGYSIAADTIDEYDNSVTLKVLLTKPGNNCIVTKSITSPYQFIEIDSTKEILIEERQLIIDCG